MDNKAPELKRCPYPHEDSKISVHFSVGTDGEYHQAICEICGSRGPKAGGADAAIAAWNRRADLHAKVDPDLVDLLVKEVKAALEPAPMTPMQIALEDIYHGQGMFGIDPSEDLKWAMDRAGKALRAIAEGESE